MLGLADYLGSRHYTGSLMDAARAVDAAIGSLRCRQLPFRNIRELHQEGMKAALEALPRYREDQGSRVGYLYVAVRRQLGNYASANLAAVAMSGHWDLAREYQHRVPVEEWHLVTTDTPETILSARETRAQKLEWHHRFRHTVDAILETLDAESAECVRLLHGLDTGVELPARQVAAKLDVPVTFVYRAQATFKRRVATHEGLHQLNQQYEEIENGQEV